MQADQFTKLFKDVCKVFWYSLLLGLFGDILYLVGGSLSGVIGCITGEIICNPAFSDIPWKGLIIFPLLIAGGSAAVGVVALAFAKKQPWEH